MNLKWISLCVGTQILQGLCYPSHYNNTIIAERQDDFQGDPICCDGDCAYQLVGDGNPHQTYWHQQVTENIDCDSAASCSTTQLTSITKSYSLSVGSAVGYLTGGFDVSESFTTGETYGCTGNPGELLCVWVNIEHTAYTVQYTDAILQSYGHCGSQSPGPLVMSSPNTNNIGAQGGPGGGYYCVTGDDCRGLSQGYWA